MREPMRIGPADLDDPRVVALPTAPVARVVAETAPGSAHAVGRSDLRASDVTG